MTPRIEFKPLEADGDFDGESPSHCRLSTTGLLSIGQMNMHVHLELIESYLGVAANPSLQSYVNRAAEQCGCEPCQLATIEVDGREYIPVVVPFAH